MDEKESTRQMYGFESGEAFELFYKGIIKGYNGYAVAAAQLFDESLVIDSTNPNTHLYRVMMGEFMHEPPAELKRRCLAWLVAAQSSQNELHIHRANESLKYYSGTNMDRKRMDEEFARKIHERNKVRELQK